MGIHRRAVLSAIGAVVPFGLARRVAASPAGGRPGLRFRSFEDGVRRAFDDVRASADGETPVRRVEVGHSDLLQRGVQGCHNDRPFAGYPAGHLRIVRAGSEPGPVVGGVRLYVCTVDVVVTGGREHGTPSRPLDFAALPPAAALIDLEPVS